MHIVYRRLVPNLSARKPVRGITRAIARRYIEITSCARPNVASRSFIIVGNATFITVVSSITMKVPTTITNNTCHL